MIQDTKAWRAMVSQQLGTSIAKVKRGVSAIMFGMDSAKWRRRENIPGIYRSPALERLEKEIKAARTLITDDEVRFGKAAMTDKPTRILSRAVERVEEEITSALSAHLREHGWITSTLIHDEIVIRHSNQFLNQNDEAQNLDRISKMNLRSFEDSRGWPPGTLQLKIQRL